MGKLFRESQLLCHPLIALRSAHAPLLPEAVKDLMGLHPLHAKGFVGKIAQRPRAALMTAHTGIAVLTLIKFLAFQAQSFCRRGAIHLCRGNKMDCTAAIAADRRNLYQRHPSLRRFRSSRLRGFLSFLLCFRPHGVLQIVSILRGKRQHSALRDPQRDRAAQGFQAGDKLLCVEPVISRRGAGQCNYLNGCRCADAIACALEYYLRRQPVPRSQLCWLAGWSNRRTIWPLYGTNTDHSGDARCRQKIWKDRNPYSAEIWDLGKCHLCVEVHKERYEL